MNKKGSKKDFFYTLSNKVNYEIRNVKKNKSAYFFLTPLILIMAVILLYPIVKALLMSFQNWDFTSSGSREGFIGLGNYIAVFSSKYFWSSLGISFIYISVTIFFRFGLGLLVALLLNKNFRGRSFARALIIIPWAVPEVIATMIFILMYDYQYGIFNQALMAINVISEPIAFLGDQDVALIAAMFVNIWKGFPFAALMLLAGLQTIPGELYEAASIDGASSFEKFKNITMPMLKPVSAIVLLLLIIWTIKDFAILYVLTQGGPGRSTEILPVYIYRLGFENFNFGMAAAAGMVLLVFTAIFTAFYLRKTNKED